MAHEVVNLRKLTNLGTFRAYVNAYLQAHPRLRQDMLMMARMMESTTNGTPLEIYAFTSTTALQEYEMIQGDIFDHLMAILPEFGLRLYQQPSGNDLRAGVAQMLAEAVPAQCQNPSGPPPPAASASGPEPHPGPDAGPRPAPQSPPPAGARAGQHPRPR